MAIDQSTINFAIYEDGTEYAGMANVQLPNLSALTQTISGAGIAGNVVAPVIGHNDAMTMTLNFRTTTKQAYSLTEPRIHDIDLRSPVQDEDPTTGEIVTRTIKHIMRVIPTSYNGGTVAPASTVDASGEYAVRYWKTTIDGEVVAEIDPFNMIYNINGVDYLAEARAAMGK